MQRMSRLLNATFPVFVLALILATSEVADSADRDQPSVSIDDVVKAWEERASKVRTLRFKWSDSYSLQQRVQDLMPEDGGLVEPPNLRSRVAPKRVKTYEPVHVARY